MIINEINFFLNSKKIMSNFIENLTEFYLLIINFKLKIF
jgi:hypothetical protein